MRLGGHPSIPTTPRLGHVDPLRIGPVHCVVCGASTREGKPWCSKHVGDHSPYAREIGEHVAAHASEVEKIVNATSRVGGGRLSPVPCPIIEAATIHALETVGRMTLDRLARTVHLPYSACSFVVDRLARKGAVELGQSKRGLVVVGLKRAS